MKMKNTVFLEVMPCYQYFYQATQHYIPEDRNLEYKFQTNVQNNWF